MEEAIKERLKKLKAMIDGGTEHEREVAQKLYDAMIDKHNLEINDIEEEKFKFDFTFKNIYEKMLMTRIHAVVTDDPEYWSYVDNRKRNKIRFKVTVSEWQIM